MTSAFDSVLVSLAVEATTGRLVRSLKESGMRVIVLGGPSIRQWLYGKGAHRRSFEVDLLVSSEDRQAVEAVVDAAQLDDGIEVELHQSIAGIGAPPEEAWRLLAGETEELLIGGEAAEVLSVPARALHVALEAARDDKTLGDFELALANAPDPVWGEAAALARRLDALPAFTEGLSLRTEGRLLLERLGLPPAAASRDPKWRRGLPRRLLG